MRTLIRRWIREENGQDVIEYSLLAAFISVIAWATLQSIGQDTMSFFSAVDAATAAATGS